MRRLFLKTKAQIEVLENLVRLLRNEEVDQDKFKANLAKPKKETRQFSCLISR